MTNLAVAILYVLAVVAVLLGVLNKSLLLIGLSCVASLTIIAVGVAAGGWKTLNPWSRS